MQDYEKFNSQLDALARWISEPEDVLRAQDPNGSSDLCLIQDRMEQLKVRLLGFSLRVRLSVWGLSVLCVVSVCPGYQPVPPVSLSLCLSVHPYLFVLLSLMQSVALHLPVRTPYTLE